VLVASRSESVLVDPEADRDLAAKGITTIPLVAAEKLRAIERRYWEIVPSDEQGIVIDFLRADRELKRVLSEMLEEAWDDAVADAFVAHYPIYSSFVVKHPGEDSSLFLHRDLCVDDERARRCFALWMPFVDTGAAIPNGALSFVPESRSIHHGAFGPNAAVNFEPYAAHLAEQLQPMDVPAGSALVYDARMVHASTPNLTSQPRLAIGCLLARRDAPVIQVHATGRRHRRVHQVDRDYFIEHHPEELRSSMPAKYPVIDEFDELPPVETYDVLGALAGPTAVRQVCVPCDVRPRLLTLEPHPGRSLRPPRHRQDLPLSAASCAGSGRGAWLGIGWVHGAVGVMDLPLLRRRRAIPAAFPTDELPRRLGTVRASAIVLDPRARVGFSVHPSRWTTVHLRVVEAPAVTAGVATAAGVAEAELGLELAIPAGPVQIWNEGPGPLLVVIEQRAFARRKSIPSDGRKHTATGRSEQRSG
jgi:hypothetical protein